MAGLPSVISDVLNDDVLTFLRRAKQVELENVELVLVEHEYKKAFLTAVNATLSEETVSEAASATYGYPYLIQLVGYYLWESMHDRKDADVLSEVLLKSKAELFRNVHRPVFSDLSALDREFLYAMSMDEGYSSVSDIGERMMRKKNFISLYRERLISAGAIKPAGRGLLHFAYPYMREFLQSKKQELA